MIPAARSSWFEKLFTLYNERYLLRRHFHTLSVRGDVDSAPEGQPILYVMNHSSWWDGLLVYGVVRRRSEREHFMMMDEKQLSQYRFFRRIGAFSIDKTTLRGVTESLQYAAQLLRQGHSVWLFPQGDIRHLEERPLEFQSGVGYLLARVPEAVVVPVTAYYTMGGHQKPEAGLWFGEALFAPDLAGRSRSEVTLELREKVERQLDAHRALAVASIRGEQAEGFSLLLGAGRSTDERFRQMKRRAGIWKSFFGR